MSKFSIKIEEDAKLDIADAYDFYLEYSPNLANYFLQHLKSEIHYLEDAPHLFRKVYKYYHQMPLRKFQYIVLYKIEGKEVKIYRVFHTSRNPKLRFKS